ncbi:MAG: hypothetical protein DAHOPDDO_00854 [Ignavibacteriaceae bacterium]|nr:hypothetical protein [Ignavibacteriaceae bacterium]
MKIIFELSTPIIIEDCNRVYKWYKREYKNILENKSWNNIVVTGPQMADCYLLQSLIDKDGNLFYWLIKQNLITSQGVGRFKCKVNRVPLYPVEHIKGKGGHWIRKLNTKKI